MGDDGFSFSKVEEYVKKFGGADRFFSKVLSSLNFPFCIINVDSFDVEISNMNRFRPGIKCYDLCFGRAHKCGDCPIDEVVRIKGKFSFERDGRDVFVYPIFGKGGKVVSVIKYGIRAREVVKEVEKEVVKEKVVKDSGCGHEESFFNILQNSQDVVYRYDFRKGGFEYVSESVYTLMGFTLAEFVGMSYDAFLSRVHPEDLDGVCEVGGNEREAVCGGEYRWKCKDGNYKWFFDRRTWLFDEDGKKLCVIGDMKDISEDKLREEDREILQKRVDLIKKRDAESEERSTLTNKEKLVLWGLCRFPLLGDQELADELKIKRSTLTAIRNRLKEKNWFSLNYIPNFASLGCQFFGILYGVVSGGRFGKLDLDFLKSTSEIFFINYQDEKFFSVFVSGKYVMFKKFLEDFEEKNKEFLKFGFSRGSYFFDLDNFEFFDFSGVIDSLFELGVKEKKCVYNFSDEGEVLNINERRVLHAMVLDPDMTSGEIAKKIWTSKPTVIKIRNKLIEENYIYPLVFPSFKKLGLKYFAKFCYEFESEIDSDFKKRNSSNTVFRVCGKNKAVRFALFASEEEYLEEVNLIKEIYRKRGSYFRLDSEIFPIQKRGKGILDFDGILNELLFSAEV